MADRRPASLEELNPWARWGVALSMRDGQPALAETALWYLELKHPELVERDGGETFLHLDRVYRVVRQGDRSWVALAPAPQRRSPPLASPVSSS
jgi:hypothetical protein